MSEYLIFADVSIDIDKKFAADNDVRYVPMEYVLGDDVFYCTEPENDEMMHNYYERLRKKIPTKTSQITPNHYIELFEPFAKEKKSILYISLSSGLSNTYDSALLAAQNLMDQYEGVDIEVVDSLSATGGMGLLTESAAKNRAAGMGIKENADWLREAAHKTYVYLKVEDLMYLKRGGRVSAATAVMGTALNVKPILEINAVGKLDTIDKKRGNKLAFKSILEKFENSFDASYGNTVYIDTADAMEDAEALKNLLLDVHPELEIKTTMLSPIIGAHTGPDMVALVFYGNRK